MLCSICKKEILLELSFKNLFTFNFICKNCHNLINEKYEIIPIDYGYILYNYYFVNEKDYTKELLELIYEKMIKIILKNRRKIILFEDDSIMPFIPYLMFKKDIIFISIFHTDFVDLYSPLYSDE